MVQITYKQSDDEIVQQMLEHNGKYLVTVHERHIVNFGKVEDVNPSSKRKKKKDTKLRE